MRSHVNDFNECLFYLENYYYTFYDDDQWTIGKFSRDFSQLNFILLLHVCSYKSTARAFNAHPYMLR